MRLKFLQGASFLPACRVKGGRRAVEDAAHVARVQRHEEASARQNQFDRSVTMLSAQRVKPIDRPTVGLPALQQAHHDPSAGDGPRRHRRAREIDQRRQRGQSG